MSTWRESVAWHLHGTCCEKGGDGVSLQMIAGAQFLLLFVAVCRLASIAAGQTNGNGAASGDLVSYKTDVLLYRISFSSALLSAKAQVERSLASEYSKNRSSGIAFQRIVLVSSKADTFAVEWTELGHVPFEEWQRRYGSLSKAGRPGLLLLGIGEDAVLVRNDGSGNLGEKLISGEDPRLMRIEGASVKIVHLSLIPISELRREIEHKKFRASVFVQVDRTPTTVLAKSILRALKPKLPEASLQVVVRNDPWFIDYAAFPVGLRFVPFLAMISEGEYLRAPEVHCTDALDGSVVCGGRSVR